MDLTNCTSNAIICMDCPLNVVHVGFHPRFPLISFKIGGASLARASNNLLGTSGAAERKCKGKSSASTSSNRKFCDNKRSLTGFVHNV